MKNSPLNVAELKNINRHIILEKLRLCPLSRAELSVKTGLAKSSVTTLTNQMIDEGLLFEVGLAKKSNKAGRTRMLLGINGDFGYVIGINLHRTKISISATNIVGKILFEEIKPTSEFKNTSAAFDYIKGQISHQIKNAGLDRKKLLGIGVSAPGPLDCEKGIILTPPNFKLFNNFKIADELKAVFDCPVFLENEAVTLALYEHYCVEEQTNNTLFVTVSNGIGGALIKNGEVYRGSHGISGELGHITVDPNGEKCACGNRGCLEQYATLDALKRRFGFVGYEEMINGAIAGEEKPLLAMEFLIKTLGAALVCAVNLFDLDKIIISGEFDYKADWLTARLLEYIKSHSVICSMHSVEVLPSGQRGFTAHLAATLPALNGFFKKSLNFDFK